MKCSLALFALIGSAALTAPLAAQSTDVPASDDADLNTLSSAPESADYLQLPATEQAVFSLQPATGESAFGPPPSQVAIQSGIDGSTIRLTFASEVSTWEDFGQAKYSLTFNAPFSKKSEIGNFITQTGLPDAYSIEGALSISLLRSDVPLELAEGRLDALFEVSNRLYRLCIAANRDLPETQKKSCEGVATEVLAERYGNPELNLASQALQLQMTEAMQEREYLGLQISGGIGRKSFDYRDPTSLAEIEDARNVFNLSTSLAYAPSLNGNLAFILGAEVERDHDLPDAEIRCPTATGTDPTITCFEASFGPAEADTEGTLFGAIRFGNAGGSLPIGGEIRLAVSPDDGEWGIEAPIYVLRDKDGKLNGGFRVGYDSEEDDVFFGVFIGSNFGLFGD